MALHSLLGSAAPWLMSFSWQITGAQKPSAPKASAEVGGANVPWSKVNHMVKANSSGAGKYTPPPVGGRGVVFAEEVPIHKRLI